MTEKKKEEGKKPEVKEPIKPETPKVEPKAFKIADVKVGDRVEFYPAGAEEPKTVVVDKAFLKLSISDEVLAKHKYAKV